MQARLPLVAIAAAVLLLPLAATGAPAPGSDYAAQAWNILPPGSDGSPVFGRHTSDQAVLYDGLTPLRGKVTSKSIQRWFKPAPLGLSGAKRLGVEHPRKGVVIARDAYGVPHVTGLTQADVAFGAGWVAAADRSGLLALLRGPGRLAALDAPGIDPLSFALSGKTFVPSAETEAFLANQLDALRSTSALGGRLVALLHAYAAGINAWHARRGLAIEPYTVRDVVAATTLLATRFGSAGGHEVENAQFLAALRTALGDRADAVFADLREGDDPETPVSVPGSFAPAANSTGVPAGSVVVDDGSYVGAMPPQQEPASSALLVGAGRSATRHPLFVAGPQMGYFFPGLLAEVDLQGAGFSARGATFPGVPYVLVGRGPDFAWSATSSQADNVDLFVETLCDGSRVKYTFRGRCVPMRRVDAGVVRQRGKPDVEVTFYETAHGPLLGYARVEGVEVGISLQRSTRGRELLSIRPFHELNTQRVTSAASFVTTMGGVELGFNWFYADDRDIAMYSSGRLPIRADGTNPALPTVGSGEYEWRGYLAPAQHARAINPRSGVILNWNNRPAAGIGAADSNFSYGSVQRVDLLRTKIAASRTHTLASVVAAMNESATQDLRAVEVWPVIREVLSTSAPPTDRADVAAALVDRWRASGASRLDRNLDGAVDAPGAAVLDAAWGGIARAVVSPVLGELTPHLAELVAPDEPAGPGGSSYASGWYGYVDKDLRALVGRRVRGAYSSPYCGAGSMPRCAQDLWVAIDEAAASLERAQGSDPEGWHADARAERIGFTGGLLRDTMRWANRPTFQQVMSFAGHRPRR